MEPEKNEGWVHRVSEGNPVMAIDTPGGRFQMRFDETTPVSAPGSLVFFAQFIEAGGRFEALCREAPLRYTSNNAPDRREVLATLVLGILAGGRRFAHLSALQFDEVAAGLLGEPWCARTARAARSTDSILMQRPGGCGRRSTRWSSTCLPSRGCWTRM